MDREHLNSGSSSRGVPRTRGDGPSSPGAASPHSLCSPHTRGWTAHEAPLDRENCVFPAHAGMDRSRDGHGRHAEACSPHTRGWTDPGIRGYPGPERVPRTRGDGPLRVRAGDFAMEVFPAHAGMDRLWCVGTYGDRSVPRTRGDGPGSGSTTGCWRNVFPAHAGMDRCWTSTANRNRRVPRTRGDGPSSPMPWWKQPPVFPAHAGMDRAAASPPGDGSACSPHTRGWTVSHVPYYRPIWSVPRTRGDGPSGTSVGV